MKTEKLFRILPFARIRCQNIEAYRKVVDKFIKVKGKLREGAKLKSKYYQEILQKYLEKESPFLGYRPVSYCILLSDLSGSNMAKITSREIIKEIISLLVVEETNTEVMHFSFLYRCNFRVFSLPYSHRKDLLQKFFVSGRYKFEFVEDYSSWGFGGMGE